MDKSDQHILAELKKDARQSVSTLAEKVSLSRSAVSDRIKRLEQNGVIRGYQVLLSESQKSAVSAYFEIQHRCGRCADVMHVFRAIPEVMTCHGISGEMELYPSDLKMRVSEPLGACNARQPGEAMSTTL